MKNPVILIILAISVGVFLLFSYALSQDGNVTVKVTQPTEASVSSPEASVSSPEASVSSKIEPAKIQPGTTEEMDLILSDPIPFFLG